MFSVWRTGRAASNKDEMNQSPLISETQDEVDDDECAHHTNGKYHEYYIQRRCAYENILRLRRVPWIQIVTWIIEISKNKADALLEGEEWMIIMFVSRIIRSHWNEWDGLSGQLFRHGTTAKKVETGNKERGALLSGPANNKWAHTCLPFLSQVEDRERERKMKKKKKWTSTSVVGL